MAPSPLLLLFMVVLIVAQRGSYGLSSSLKLDMHHRFSDHVRQWAETTGVSLPGGWPELRSAEYYAALAAHDRGRHLADASGPQELTFVDGNMTVRIASLGFLHYAVVAVGTPNVTFLVALDTGSNLFWVPCDCQQCAPLTSPNYGTIVFDTYSPSLSTTSKIVPCSSSFCELKDQCPANTSYCPYEVAYLSDETTNGYLVEDVLYLTTEDQPSRDVQTRITFGCGRNQTGSFLGSAAPNGLFGLGMDRTAVPSILAAARLIPDSFSMCFGHNGIGRIKFGDKGSSDQDETPFHLSKQQPTYNISATDVTVGNSSFRSNFSAIFDSGTSFTILEEELYNRVTETFTAQVPKRLRINDSDLPFEYCYQKSNANRSMFIHSIPRVSFTMESGSQFNVVDPIVEVSDERQQVFAYCLAVIKSRRLNIIGQNFMTGQRIVFDRERLVLGWKRFNCSDVDNSMPIPVDPGVSPSPSPTNLPPTITTGPSSNSPGPGNQNRPLNSSPRLRPLLSGASASALLVLILAII